MLDIRLIRSDPDTVKAALARRGEDLSSIDALLDLDEVRRAKTGERDELRAQVNALSKEVGAMFRDGRKDEAAALQDQSRAAGEQEKALDAEVAELDARIRDQLLRIPNLPSVDAPDGGGEDDNVVLRTEGYDADAYGEHQRVPHWDIAADLRLLDPDRATRISGAMFTMFRGQGARLLRAMVQLSLDRNGDAYEEIRPPTLVRTDTMISTGHLPKFSDDAYHVERDDLWAIPTAEVPLTSLGGGEIIDEAELPMKFMAYTSCFRREAGSAGRDTRGLLRSHEFDKVELLSYSANAEQAIACQEDVLARSESILTDLGLAYRVVDLCTGDLGNSSARTWDLEAYAPGCDLWLEVSSVSWFSTYQARRAHIRYRPTDGGSPEVVHTVNGSAMGWPRTWAAVVETHRQPDGSIAIPEVLRPYMGGADRIAAR
ncbi:MAG: serine--tRNA ligase [Acidimicrobiales bacterium]